MVLSSLVLTLLLGAEPSPTEALARSLAAEALQKSASPRAAAALLRLHALKDEVDDLASLGEPLAALSSKSTTHPQVRSLARFLLADVERARGRSRRAEEAFESLGLVQDFFVVGGFDNDGKSGCDTDWGPESGLDLKAVYPAARGDLGWKPLTQASVDGYVDVGAAVRPNQKAVAYALTVLDADRADDVVFALGTAGAYRLFVNGALVGKGQNYNVARLDQARIKVPIRRGLNRVMLKVCNEGGPLGFYLRTERSASGLRLKVALQGTLPPLEKGPKPVGVPQASLATLLADAVKANPRDAALRLDYAAVLAALAAFDPSTHAATHEAQAAAASSPDDAAVNVGAARLSTDLGQRRRLLERALQVDPASPWAKLELAQLEHETGHHDLALAAAQALRKEWKHWALAWRLEVAALEALDASAEAQVSLGEALRACPHVPALLRVAASNAVRGLRLDDALAFWRMALGVRASDVGARRAFSSQLANMGRTGEAVEEMRRALALDPFDNDLRLRLAELLAANGAKEDAWRTFAEAMALCPDDADVFEREGRARLGAGEGAAALKAFDRSLGLRPQNPTLKELVRSLRGGGERAAEGLDFTWKAPTQEALAKLSDDALYLVDASHTAVQTNGLSTRTNAWVVKVLSNRGVDMFRRISVPYAPARQEVRVLKARITKPDGSIVDGVNEADQQANEPWSGMYYDTRARVLSFPDLAAGDILDVRWRIDDVAADNLLADYFGDVDFVQGMSAKERYLYVVDMPEGRPLYWNRSTLPAWVTVKTQTDKGRTTYRFEARDVARLTPEPNMPGPAEVSAVLHVSTYKSWDAVGRFYWGLVRDQLTPTDDVRRLVDTTLSKVDRKDTRKVVQALYAFVVTHTRYVALEFGIHSYKPYRVDRVLSRRFGDCKDKAALLVTLLKLAGVEARMVLLRMRSLGRLAEEPASLSAFNHAIAYVPALDLYLDGTAEFHGTQELPGPDRGTNALIVEPEGESRWVITPEARADANQASSKLTVVLKPDGSATVTADLSFAGQNAPAVRQTYAAAATRKSTFEEEWARAFPGLTAESVEAQSSTELEKHMHLSAKFRAPRYAEATPQFLRFFPFGAARAYGQSLASLTERKSDVVLPGPWVETLSATYPLPQGYTASEPLPAFESVSRFGRASVKVRVEAGVLNCEGEFRIDSARISASDYPKFRAWVLEVDQAFGQRVTVRTAAATGASR